MLPPMVSRSEVKSVSSGSSVTAIGDTFLSKYVDYTHTHARAHTHARTHAQLKHACNSRSIISELLETRAGGMVQTLSPVSGSYQYLRILDAGIMR